MKSEVKNEYEGYWWFGFEDPSDVNQLLTNYVCYEQYWKRLYLEGLFFQLKSADLTIFKKFECIVMQKEPLLEAVLVHQNQYILKLWFVCELKDEFVKDDQETNKQFIIDYVIKKMNPAIQQQYNCQLTLQYLDIAADIQE